MIPGSVILDLVARQGGNCQLTKKFEIYEESINHVRIIGLTNFESQMARLSSEIYSECIFRLFEELIDVNSNPQNTAKNFKINFEDELIRNLTVLYFYFIFAFLDYKIRELKYRARGKGNGYFSK